jgi:hypothetical protein
MVKADLTKPGRRSILARGERYRVYAQAFDCIEIERISDGASLLLQGDDVIILRGE